MVSTENGIAQIKDRIQRPNFVNIVGYSEEKAHSGFLKWLLERPGLGFHLAAGLWDLASSDSVRLDPRVIAGAAAEREWKVGHRALDLHVELTLRDDSARHLFCEFKVDGTPGYRKQARELADGCKSRAAGEDHAFVWLSLGGARFWKSPDPPWCSVDPGALLALLAGLDIGDDQVRWLVEQYRDALVLEILRGEVADPRLKEWRDLGFRGRDLWYAFYHRLKSQLADPQNWSIYSGINNPILANVAARRDLPVGRLIYELNWRRFVVKILWKKGNQSGATLRRLLDTLWSRWKSSPLASRYDNARRGGRARNPKGVSTLLSVGLDLSDPGVAAQRVDELSDAIGEMLAETAAAWSQPPSSTTPSNPSAPGQA
jgi:hypothetical protein